jgi:RimJ/RimL family protein N-acetyltransferase
MEQEYVGRSVRLRPLKSHDVDAVVSLYRSTPNYWESIDYGREPVSKLQLQNDLRDAQQSEDYLLFGIERLSDRALIGVADVRMEATMSDAATIALLLIGGPYQQQGYGSESAELLEQALFAQPDVEFIMAGVAESSEIGQRFWLRRGYQYSGSTTHDPKTERTTIWLAKKRPMRKATTS